MDIRPGENLDLGLGKTLRLLQIDRGNLRCVDELGSVIWIADGEFSGASFDGVTLRAYDTYGFSKTIDLESGAVQKSILVK